MPHSALLASTMGNKSSCTPSRTWQALTDGIYLLSTAWLVGMRMPVPSAMVASANGEHEVGRWGLTEIARQSFLCNDDGNNDSRDTAVSKHDFLT